MKRNLVPKRKRTYGFTLIELLVVIAIIALIAAILFPVFASARDKARASACMSNENQLGLAIMQYEQDYDDMTVHGDNAYGEAAGWAGSIYPYVKSLKVFVCPSDTTTNALSSYGYNSNLEGYISPPPAPQPIMISQMTSPANTVQMFEVVGNIETTYYTKVTVGEAAPTGCGESGTSSSNAIMRGDNYGTGLEYATGYLYNCTTQEGCGTYEYSGPLGRHQNGSNFLMCDGHAKWFMGSKVGAGYDFMPSWSGGSHNVPTGVGYCGASGNAPATDCTKISATFAWQ